MKWIVSALGEIVLNIQELHSRSEYIKLVADVEPTEWELLYSSNGEHKFYLCVTDDGINGVFVTGHIGDVMELCKSDQIADCEFMRL